MSNFVSLEEAAKKLGVSAQQLVDMRSRGDIFGYRDGSSWKFKPEEIERVAGEMMGSALDEDPAGSSILVSESDLGSSSKHGSTIGSDAGDRAEGSSVGSDVELVADPGSGSDVRLVANKGAQERPKSEDSELGLHGDDDLPLPASDDDDDELALASEDGEDLLAAASDSKPSSDVELTGSDLGLSGSSLGSDLELSGSDALELGPATDESNVGGGSELRLKDDGLIHGDSDPSIDGSDLELNDSDLVLGGGSDLALGSDSGINLMSPADSGISLEDEPLDLAASGISGLDLAAEGSDVESPSGSGSAVDFQQDEEFQLSPSGALEADDDSGSQVIELEDSTEFGDAAVALPDGGFDAFSDVEGGSLEGEEGFGDPTPAGAPVVMGTPEVPFNSLQVVALLLILLLMCLSGILMTDIVRNMWAWAGSESTLTSGFTEMILSALGMKN